MGEAKQEEAKPEVPKPAEEKKEEKHEEKKEEKAEDKKDEEIKPSPPSPIVLYVDLHCVGCAKKIKRAIFKCKGVEDVEVDMSQNEVKVKGIVDPRDLCSRIQKKTMRTAKVLSPLPPPVGDTTTPPEAPASQVSGAATVELQVNMHCQPCADQLRRKILKIRGVQAVETDVSASKVTVTGTMCVDRLLKYIHSRTGKLAAVIPPPPPPPPKEEETKKEEPDKKPEENPSETKKEENPEKKEEEKAPQEPNNADGGKDEKAGGGDTKKEGEGISEEDIMAKKLAYLYGGGMINYGAGMVNEEEMARRMVHWMPVYVMEPPRLPPPPPPPQLFSDENPNACCIT